MNYFRPPVLRSAAACLAAIIATGAWNADAQVNWVGPNTATWNTNTAWSDGLAPSSGKNYFVNISPTLWAIRTATGSSTFGGGSLTVSGQLELRVGAGNVATANNLTLTDGSVVVSAVASSTQTLAGTLQIADGTSYFRSSTGTNNRNVIIDSSVGGGSNAAVQFLRLGTYTLNNGGNTFSGTWTVGGSANIQVDGTVTTVSNNSTNFSTLKATPSGSLGSNANVELNLWSRFDVDYDWVTSGSLTLASNEGSATAVFMTLDQNITVGALTVDGFSFAAGATYSYTDLSTAGYANYFTDSGGTITVIPEPAAVGAILGLGLFGIVLLRRRRR